MGASLKSFRWWHGSYYSNWCLSNRRRGCLWNAKDFKSRYFSWISYGNVIFSQNNSIRTLKEVLTVIQPQLGCNLCIFIYMEETRLSTKHLWQGIIRNTVLLWANRRQRRLSCFCQLTTSTWLISVDTRIIIHIDYLQEGKTIKSEYHANLLDQYSTTIWRRNDRIGSRRRDLSPR